MCENNIVHPKCEQYLVDCQFANLFSYIAIKILVLLLLLAITFKNGKAITKGVAIVVKVITIVRAIDKRSKELIPKKSRTKKKG